MSKKQALEEYYHLQQLAYEQANQKLSEKEFIRTLNWIQETPSKYSVVGELKGVPAIAWYFLNSNEIRIYSLAITIFV